MKVFFDFDGTLTTKDSLLPFLLFVVGWPRFILKSIFLLPLICRYFFNRNLRGQVKNKAILLYLSKYTPTQLEQFVAQFIDTILPTMMRPEGMSILEKHVKNGDECILVSASINLYLAPWAKQNHFTHVIATPFLGTPPLMIGQNCYGEEKVDQILKQYPEIQTENCYAYGDTIGDIPMLKLAQKGFMWSDKQQQFIEINAK